MAANPKLNRRERVVLGAVRDLTDAAIADGCEPPVFFDQEVIELAVGPAPGSLDALMRLRYLNSRPGGKSPLGWALTDAGRALADRRTVAGIVVPHWGARG